MSDDLTERLCEEMHDRYEAAAVEAGWETQQRSRVPWVDVPEANKATMRAAVGPIADALAALTAERDALLQVALYAMPLIGSLPMDLIPRREEMWRTLAKYHEPTARVQAALAAVPEGPTDAD